MALRVEDIDRAAVEARWRLERSDNPHLRQIEQLYADGVLPTGGQGEISIHPGALPFEGLQLLYALALQLRPRITVETGFGFGMSAWALLAAHQALGHDGHHIAIDPWYAEWTEGAGKIHIESLGFRGFHLLEHPSMLGLPQLLMEGVLQDLRLALIDGSHLFEQALLDLCYLDKALAVGGVLLLDDADAPAVETLLHYVEANLSHYAVSRAFLPVAVLQKTGPDQRRWDHFVPFSVSPRRQWPGSDAAS